MVKELRVNWLLDQFRKIYHKLQFNSTMTMVVMEMKTMVKKNMVTVTIMQLEDSFIIKKTILLIIPKSLTLRLYHMHVPNQYLKQGWKPIWLRKNWPLPAEKRLQPLLKLKTVLVNMLLELSMKLKKYLSVLSIEEGKRIRKSEQ